MSAGVVRGFTLIELLVVVAIIAILAGLILTGAAKARSAAHRTLCMSRLRQLQLAWGMYANDHGEVPKQLGDYTERAKPGSWVVGDANEDHDAYNIRRGSLFPYAGSTSVYTCPSDRSQMTNSAGVFPKNRSYSMSSGLQDAQIRLPSQVSRPSGTFVFSEEAEVDEGILVIPYPPKRRWKSNDYPANHHFGVYQMTFVDGHVEAMPWVNPAAAVPWGLGGADLVNIQGMLPESNDPKVRPP